MWEAALRTFLVIFLAEMGDKSQFLMLALSAEYRLRDIIAGVSGAVCVLNLLAIGVGTALGSLLPLPLISVVAGLAFLSFALTGLRREEGGAAVRRGGRALPAIFGTYFLAELGDKTQLTALALAAGDGALSPSGALAVFLGATAGLLGAGLLALLVGYVLGRRLPVGVFGWVSFLIFAACGTVRLLDGLQACLARFPAGVWLSAGVTAAVLSGFLILCVRLLRGQRRAKTRGGGRDDTGAKQSVSVQ